MKFSSHKEEVGKKLRKRKERKWEWERIKLFGRRKEEDNMREKREQETKKENGEKNYCCESETQ